jgi:hypothetical protein
MATRTATKKTATRKTPARTRTARTAVATVTPNEPSATRRVLTKSRAVVPLLVAVGLGAAVVRRMLRGKRSAAVFQRAAMRLPPKVGEAIQALAALGREVRASASR